MPVIKIRTGSARFDFCELVKIILVLPDQVCPKRKSLKWENLPLAATRSPRNLKTGKLAAKIESTAGERVLPAVVVAVE